MWGASGTPWRQRPLSARSAGPGVSHRMTAAFDVYSGRPPDQSFAVISMQDSFHLEIMSSYRPILFGSAIGNGYGSARRKYGSARVPSEHWPRSVTPSTRARNRGVSGEVQDRGCLVAGQLYRCGGNIVGDMLGRPGARDRQDLR